MSWFVSSGPASAGQFVGVLMLLRITHVCETLGRASTLVKGSDVIAVFEPRELLKVEQESLCIKLEGVQV